MTRPIHRRRDAEPREGVEKYSASERRTILGRIRKAAKSRRLSLPDPEEFMELMARVRRKRTERAKKAKRSMTRNTD